LYCYEDSAVLINKLGIKNHAQLKRAEDEITYQRLIELSHAPINGNFTLTHLLNIHKYIFSDLYSFAGKIRREDIFKGQTRFFPHYLIKRELLKLLSKLKNEAYLFGLPREGMIERLAYYLSELNIIHPFREGNGRTIREFIRLLAERSNYLIDWSKIGKKELLDAVIESELNTEKLCKCLDKSLEIIDE
jgi:cell filamentation protein